MKITHVINNEFQVECEDAKEVCKIEDWKKRLDKNDLVTFDHDGKSFLIDRIKDGLDQEPLYTYMVLVK